MNKRKFFLLPICLLLLGACNANQSSPESKEDVKSSEPEVSSVTEDTSTPCEHEFGAWAITRRPTCEGKGEQSRICTKCGEIEKQDVDPLGHSWDEGRVTTPATEEAEGVFTYSCKRSGCTATKTEAIPKLEGYNVTFVTQHCTIKIFKTKSYDVDPVDLVGGKTVSRNGDTGDATKYVADDPATENVDEEIKPQVNFKVICETGYKLASDSISISGTQGTDWNNCKAQAEGIYRITVIKADITVTVTPIVDDGSATIDAAKATVAATHCTVKFYVGPKDDTGSNVDAGPVFYSRSKTEPYGYLIGDNAQLNFEVVPESGYEFVDATVYTDGEAKKADCAFVTGGYNKIKKVDNNLYRLTKVTGDVTITVTCTAISA